METEELKNKQTKFLEEIKNQDKLNKSLKEEAMLQKQSCEELESDLSTKNKLVSLCYTLLWLCSVKVERRLMLKHNILTGASGRWPKALGIVVDCDMLPKGVRYGVQHEGNMILHTGSHWLGDV